MSQTTTFSKIEAKNGSTYFVNLDNVRHILVSADESTLAVYSVGSEFPLTLRNDDAATFLLDIQTFSSTA